MQVVTSELFDDGGDAGLFFWPSARAAVDWHRFQAKPKRENVALSGFIVGRGKKKDKQKKNEMKDLLISQKIKREGKIHVPGGEQPPPLPKSQALICGWLLDQTEWRSTPPARISPSVNPARRRRKRRRR